MPEYNITDKEEMSQIISIAECRKLREIVHNLTAAPILTKYEYLRLMVIFNQVCDRLEKEEVTANE